MTAINSNNKKLIIFLILIILGIFLLWIFRSPFQSGKAKKSLRIAPAFSKSKKQIVPSDKSAESGRLKSSYSSWGRNPFTLGGQLDVVGLSLKGILWDEVNPIAIINDNIVKVGEEIEGKKVIEIKKDKVIINDGKSNLELKLLWENE